MAAPAPVRARLDALASATQRLFASLDGLADPEVLRGPSVLPGWSRAHVLTHLARNADGNRNLLLAARTGVTLSMYPSRDLRNADIEAGVGRPLELIVLDARAAAERLAVDLEALPDACWAGTAGIGPTGQPMPAPMVVTARLCEVEAHHVDLDLGHGFDRTPADAALAFLDQLPARFANAPLAPCTVTATDLDRSWSIGSPADGDAVVSGTSGALLAWALRGATDGLASTTGTVPPSPGWG